MKICKVRVRDGDGFTIRDVKSIKWMITSGLVEIKSENECITFNIQNLLFIQEWIEESK